MTSSRFIEPDRTLEDIADPAAALGININSGFRAVAADNRFAGQSRIFDRIVERQRKVPLRYEDQCSSQYYFDLVRTLRDFNGQFDRVAEVGVFMGGSTSFLAGCIAPFDFDLDLIDLSSSFLKFAYERVRRLYPASANRIRLFHGDLPSYIRHVMLTETGHSYIVHHDGPHNFEQVVKDLASLYYVKQSLEAVIVQDTHLRGSINYMNFVDLALHAVFGTDPSYAPIGAVHESGSPFTEPNKYQGNYFVASAPEGMVLPMAINDFKYPHAMHSMDDFLPPAD